MEYLKFIPEGWENAVDTGLLNIEDAISNNSILQGKVEHCDSGYNLHVNLGGNVKGIIAIGQCRERVLDFGKENNIPTYAFEHLRDGFPKCFEISEEGDIVLLSPASASWDQYKECEVRGAEFKDLVKKLKESKN